MPRDLFYSECDSFVKSIMVHEVLLARGVPIVALDATLTGDVPVHLVIVLNVLLGMRRTNHRCTSEVLQPVRF